MPKSELQQDLRRPLVCLVHGEVEEERVKVIKVEKFEPDPVQGVLAL